MSHDPESRPTDCKDAQFLREFVVNQEIKFYQSTELQDCYSQVEPVNLEQAQVPEPDAAQASELVLDPAAASV